MDRRIQVILLDLIVRDISISRKLSVQKIPKLVGKKEVSLIVYSAIPTHLDLKIAYDDTLGVERALVVKDPTLMNFTMADELNEDRKAP